jgi:hypothetical protein
MSTSASLVPKGINEASFTQSQLPFILEATETISFAGGEHSPMCSLSGAGQHQSCPISKLPFVPGSRYEDSPIGSLLEQAVAGLEQNTRAQILEGRISLQTILKAGLKAISREASPGEVDSIPHGTGQRCDTNDAELRTDKILVLQHAKPEGKVALLPDIYRNHFRMKQVLYVACVYGQWEGIRS